MTSPQTEELAVMHLRVKATLKRAVEQYQAGLDNRSLNWTTAYLIERGLQAVREERTGRPAGGAS